MIQTFIKDSFIYSIPIIISRGLGIILLPIYTRITSAEELGALELFFAFGNLAGTAEDQGGGRRGSGPPTAPLLQPLARPHRRKVPRNVKTLFWKKNNNSDFRNDVFASSSSFPSRMSFFAGGKIARRWVRRKQGCATHDVLSSGRPLAAASQGVQTIVLTFFNLDEDFCV